MTREKQIDELVKMYEYNVCNLVDIDPDVDEEEEIYIEIEEEDKKKLKNILDKK